MAVNYASVEDIEKDFGKRIKALEEDDEEGRRSLRVEQREAVADFREAAAQQATLNAHRTSVAATAGVPVDLLSGSTAEEIDASAERLKAYAATIQAPAAPEPTAAEMYGRPGGGGGAPVTGRDDTVEQLQDYEKRFNSSTRGSRVRTSPTDSPAEVTVNEGERYIQRLGAAHLVAHLADNSRNPSVREFMRKIDPNTLKPK